jgi:ribosomal protein S18 acetylase RimI-like enzyme
MTTRLWSGRVRPAGIHDLDILTPLFEDYRAFYRAPRRPAESRAFLRDRIRYNQSSLFLAEESDGRAAGFAQVYPTFTSVGLAQLLVLNDLYVVPASRRCGVAQALLDAVRDFGQRCGATKLRLSTAVDNHAAQRVYERAGWRQSNEFIIYDISTLDG